MLGTVLVLVVGVAGWWFTRTDDPPRDNQPAGSTVSPPVSADAAAGEGRMDGAGPAPAWTAWQPLPVAPVFLTGAPAAARPAGTSTFVVQRDGVGQPWFSTNDHDGTFGDWRKLPAFKAIEDLAVTAPGPGRVDVLAVSQDRLLYRSSFADGRWGDWTRIDATTRITGAPAAMGTGDRLEILVCSGDTLMHGTLVGSNWTGFDRVARAGKIDQAPAVTGSAPGTLDAFVVGADGHELLHLAYTAGAWHEPVRVGGVRAGGRPAASWTAATGLTVVVPDTGGHLIGMFTRGNGWQPAGLTPPAGLPKQGGTAPPAALTAADDRIDAYVLGPQRRVQVAPSA